MTFRRLNHIGGGPVASLCELEANVVYLESSRPARLHRKGEREGGKKGGRGGLRLYLDLLSPSCLMEPWF